MVDAGLSKFEKEVRCVTKTLSNMRWYSEGMNDTIDELPSDYVFYSSKKKLTDIAYPTMVITLQQKKPCVDALNSAAHRTF